MRCPWCRESIDPTLPEPHVYVCGNCGKWVVIEVQKLKEVINGVSGVSEK